MTEEHAYAYEAGYLDGYSARESEIVRCRDCERFHTNTNGFDCPNLDPDGFCAWHVGRGVAMTSATDNRTTELRDKCRTCRFLSLNEGNWSSGYCWQSDKHVNFVSYTDFPKEHDPRCQEVIRDGGESVWEPLMILKPYFTEDDDDE